MFDKKRPQVSVASFERCQQPSQSGQRGSWYQVALGRSTLGAEFHQLSDEENCASRFCAALIAEAAIWISS